MSGRSRNRYTQIGLDRLVRLAWLQKTASLQLAGNSSQEVKTYLQEELRPSFRSADTQVRGSIDKTITVLMKAWVNVSPEVEDLRLEGLQFLRDLSPRDSLAVHWGMLMAAYPFWGAVATQVGRLLRLQGSAAATHVQRRIREQYGERETVSRRARYVMRSFLDWRVLRETSSMGIYSAESQLSVENAQLIAWLVEAFLQSRSEGSFPLKELLDNPSLFPFRLGPIHGENLVGSSSRLDILRHGLDEDLVVLRRE